METNNSQTKTEPNSGLIVHQVLAVSYVVYLIAIFAGLTIEFFWDLKIDSPIFAPVGVVCILFGTYVSFWAQYVSKKGSNTRNNEKDSLSHIHFSAGPYGITRSPTQYGLLFMALGLSFLYGSIVMVVMTLIAFVLGKFVFIPMEEHHLIKKYGQSYADYKKKVRF